MGRSRTVARWSVVVVLVATIVVGLGVPAQASEQAHWTAGRFTARVPSAITSVSCPRWSNCTAVTDQGTTLRYLDRTWRSVRTADRDLGSLSSVSCPSTSFCVAVGGKVRAAEHRGRWDQVSAATFDQRAVRARARTGAWRSAGTGEQRATTDTAGTPRRRCRRGRTPSRSRVLRVPSAWRCVAMVRCSGSTATGGGSRRGTGTHLTSPAGHGGCASPAARGTAPPGGTCTAGW